MSQTIYLIRHGKTRANLEKRFAGRSPEPLHPEGVSQIRQVAEKLGNRKIAAIYCGPLPRTVQSAGILAEHLGAEVVADPGLNEIDIPHWDTLTKDEIRLRYGDQYPVWLAAPDEFAVPGCETIVQVQERAAGSIESIVARHADENVLVVSHLIVIRSLILHYRHMEIGAFRGVVVDNASVVELVRHSDGRTKVDMQG